MKVVLTGNVKQLEKTLKGKQYNYWRRKAKSYERIIREASAISCKNRTWYEMVCLFRNKLDEADFWRGKLKVRCNRWSKECIVRDCFHAIYHDRSDDCAIDPFCSHKNKTCKCVPRRRGK